MTTQTIYIIDPALRSQTDTVLAHLKEVGTISPMEGLIVYKITRLAARIHELRRAGYNILSRRSRDLAGARYVRYELRGRGR